MRESMHMRMAAAEPAGKYLTFMAVVALRDMLAGASENGVGRDTGHAISCQITPLGAQAALVTVEDEGGGANTLEHTYCNLPAEHWSPGLRLVSMLSDELRFEEAGRRVVCRLSWDAEGYLSAMGAPSAPNAGCKEGSNNA